MKRILFYLLAALALAGCATTQDAYIEAQKAALVREGDARVAEAQAIAAVASKLDAGGAAAYAVMVAARMGQASQQPVVQRPRDWLDYAQGVANIVGVLGQVAVPIASIRANRDVAIAGYNRDIGMAQVQQAGETARIQSVAGIATSVAQVPRTSITVTAGGDSVVGSGTIDRRDCRTFAGHGGDAAPGAVFRPDLPINTAPVPGGPGGPGGAATGGC